MCRNNTNPFNLLILIALWFLTVMNLVLVVVMDPGYVFDGDVKDTEDSIFCSRSFLLKQSCSAVQLLNSKRFYTL